jgi:hypothetical protein
MVASPSIHRTKKSPPPSCAPFERQRHLSHRSALSTASTVAVLVRVVVGEPGELAALGAMERASASTTAAAAVVGVLARGGLALRNRSHPSVPGSSS